jgi:hypothetical protein
MIPFVRLFRVLLEDILSDVIDDLFGRNQNIGAPVHPQRHSVKFQIYWVLMVVHPHPTDVASFQQQVVTIDLSEILA